MLSIEVPVEETVRRLTGDVRGQIRKWEGNMKTLCSTKKQKAHYYS